MVDGVIEDGVVVVTSGVDVVGSGSLDESVHPAAITPTAMITARNDLLVERSTAGTRTLLTRRLLGTPVRHGA